MQLTNEEKKQLIGIMRDIVLSACELQQQMDLLHTMSNLSDCMLGLKLSDGDYSKLIEERKQRYEDNSERFAKFLEIDFENDPFWKEVKDAEKENKVNEEGHKE